MLQSIRDKITGWFAMVFLGAIAIVFIFWGVDMGSNAGARYAAEVNGEGIDIETVRRAWQEREQRLQQMLRGPVPEEMVKSQQQALIDEQIRTELLTQRARELGYRVSDAMMQQTINGFAELQVDGKFSQERYELLLRQQGRTIGEFERDLRASMEIEQLQRGIAASAFVTPIELLRREALEGEQRELDYAVIPASSFLTAVTVTDAQIQSWYEAHQGEYKTPETVDLEYLELKLADVERDVPVNDEALQAYYEQVKEQLTTPERRRARHILITTEGGVDDATALKTVDEVMAKLNGGGDFAALAKQYSKDAVSAAKGGDLDWAARGMFVGPFEDALFAMSKGELRGPVKTQFGYHILRLDETEGGETKSFADARAELERDYRVDKAQALFYERSQKLADEAFKALTELATVGTALNLPVQKVAGYTRQGGGVFGSETKVIEAVFRTESLEKGENSALIGLGDDRAIVLRVAAHQAPVQLPVAAVRTQIEFKLKEQGARDAAAKRGAELLARLSGGAVWTAVLTEAKLATIGKRTIGRTDSSVPAPVRKAAFDIPRTAVAPAKIAYRGTVTEDGSYAIVAVSDVRAGVLVAGTPESAAKARQAVQSQGGGEFNVYVSEAVRNAKIERNPKVFE
jgi:peptidyl-prolyl cis-trans isomerase D